MIASASRRLAIVSMTVLVASALVPVSGARAETSAIAGVRLGVGRAAVRNLLGAPRRTRSGSHVEYVPATGGPARRPGKRLEYLYPDRLVVTFTQLTRHGGLRVFAVTTRSPLDRYPSGIHVGSTRAQLRGAFGTRHLLCESAAGLSGEGRCKLSRGFVGSGLNDIWQGWDYTDFYIHHGRVAEIRLSYFYAHPPIPQIAEPSGCAYALPPTRIDCTHAPGFG